MKQLILLLLATLPASAQPGRFGLPACTASGRQLADRAYFLLCHSATLNAPVWSAYELTPARLQHPNAKRPTHFHRDLTLTGAGNTDYRNSGYHRGHLAPAADFAFSEDAIRSTFTLANAVPQNPNLNTGRWAQLESAVRRLAASSDALYVITGAIYPEHPAIIGSHQIPVPSHLFKVVLAIQGDTKLMFAAILPNAPCQSQALSQFAASVEEVERRTGLDFFSALDDTEEETLEAQHNSLSK